jgi:uncharacterized LabA/DUF88 family protein
VTHAATFVDYENISLQVDRALRENRNRPTKSSSCAESTLRLLELALDRIEDRFDLSMVLARAFADWETIAHHNAQQGLTLMNVRPVYVLGRRGRSAVDIQLSLAAQRLLLTRTEIEAFVFLTGDRCCIPIVSEVLDAGKDVVVASMRSSMSGDLVRLVGNERIFALDSIFDELRQTLLSVADSEECAGGAGDRGEAAPVAAGNHLDEAHQQRFAELVKRATVRYPRGVWLGPFFKNFMNEEFGELNNDQRKELVDQARRNGMIRIRYVEDDSSVNGGYSVLEPIDPSLEAEDPVAEMTPEVAEELEQASGAEDASSAEPECTELPSQP